MNNNQFIEWFVGFSDGESNFTIGLDKRGKTINLNFRFMIGLHMDDKPLLNFILNNLGCGYIHNNNNKSVSQKQKQKNLFYYHKSLSFKKYFISYFWFVSIK